MKFKFNMRLLILICAFVFLVFSIISIRDTFARYISSLTTKSYVEMGSWLIAVNDHNVMENSNFSAAMTPLVSTSSEYVAEGKIVPGATGYVELEIDYSNVRVPFTYAINYEPDDSTPIKDIKLVGYTIGETTSTYTGGDITSTIIPDNVTTSQTVKFNFLWLDTAGEESDDIQDTKFSNTLENVKLNFDISFTQLTS